MLIADAWVSVVVTRTCAAVVNVTAGRRIYARASADVVVLAEPHEKATKILVTYGVITRAEAEAHLAVLRDADGAPQAPPTWLADDLDAAVAAKAVPAPPTLRAWRRSAPPADAVHKTAAMVLLSPPALADWGQAGIEAGEIFGPVPMANNPHCTLVYFGKLTHAEALRAADGLIAGLATVEPIPVEGQGIATFPAGDKGTPLIVAYASPEMTAAREAVVAKVGDLMRGPQHPEFRPHATLAYLPTEPTEEQAGALETAKAGHAPWTATAIALWMDGVVVETIDLAAEVTDFPVVGGRDAVTLGASRVPVFDPAFAAELEAGAPEVWDLAGQVDGNDAAVLLQAVVAQGGAPRDEDQADAIRAREAWAATHTGATTLATVVEAIKWLVVLPVGEAAMKRTIEAARTATERGTERGMTTTKTKGGEVVCKAFGMDLDVEVDGVVQRLIAATTADPDRYDDVVDQDTLQTTNWLAAGGSLLYAHEYDDVVVGRAKPGTVSVKLIPGGKKALCLEPEWDDHPVNPMGQLVAHQWGTFLKAVSIGFRPGQGSCARSALPMEHYAYKKDGYGMFYMNCEILEISVVTVPANPYALEVQMAAKGMGGGGIDIKAALLAALQDPTVLARVRSVLTPAAPVDPLAAWWNASG